jgi:serine/threonine protein phosphatase PrpC
VEDAGILSRLNAGRPASETAEALVADALAAGGRDNVTIVLVDVLDAPINTEHTIGDPRPAE